MKTIELKNLLEDNNYPDAGSVLFYIIKNAIGNSEKIIIDMKDVISIPTMFMNTSFGSILDEFSMEDLKGTISFKNISKSQIERIQKYLSDYNQLKQQANIMYT